MLTESTTIQYLLPLLLVKVLLLMVSFLTREDGEFIATLLSVSSFSNNVLFYYDQLFVIVFCVGGSNDTIYG